MSSGFESYIILLECPSVAVKTRSRLFEIKAGVYAYVGSCGASCCKRLARHYSASKKRFWHIDYLSVECGKLGFYLLQSPEPLVARILASRFEFVPGFGSSDDRSSPSHLFRVDPGELQELLESLPASSFQDAREESEALELCLGTARLNNRL